MASAISIKKLSYSWPGQEPVLNIERFLLQRGERCFIKGPSGSGKSTLLSLVGGIVQPQQGNIELLEQSLNDLKSAQRDRFRADHIGFIFQMFNLLPYLSVLDNVLLPCRFSKLRRTRAEQAGELAEVARALLQALGLNDERLYQRPVTELSIGQQQRVAAARALIGSPEILIADEPTSALDHDNRDAFLDCIQQQCQLQNTTLLFVSHDTSLQSHFDRHVDLAAINNQQEMPRWQC